MKMKTKRSFVNKQQNGTETSTAHMNTRLRVCTVYRRTCSISAESPSGKRHKRRFCQPTWLVSMQVFSSQNISLHSLNLGASLLVRPRGSYSNLQRLTEDSSPLDELYVISHRQARVLTRTDSHLSNATALTVLSALSHQRRTSSIPSPHRYHVYPWPSTHSVGEFCQLPPTGAQFLRFLPFISKQIPHISLWHLASHIHSPNALYPQDIPAPGSHRTSLPYG